MPGDQPWLRHYGRVPATLEYPEVTLHEALAATARRVPQAIAWDFLDTPCTYAALIEDVERCAAAFAALGLGRGDRIVIALPTCPQAVIAFYAANRLGAVAAMVHPLSTARELTHYLDASRATVAITLDAFYAALAKATPKSALRAIVLAKIGDYLPPLKRLGFWAKKGRLIPRAPPDPRLRWWRDLMAGSHPAPPAAGTTTRDPAAILFSGGTTGEPKGVVLSSRNFIAEGLQVCAWGAITGADSTLAILPVFHGFGLGVCVNATLMAGGRTILVPAFDAKGVARLIRRKRPNLVVGVPTLFDALTREPAMRRADLSCLRACYCGADTLPRLVKERFEALVAERGGKVRLLEGYGLTEAVTAVIVTPVDGYREGSIGLPFPDMRAAICRPGRTEECPPGEEGEICVSGPNVMLGYLEDEVATAQALRVHPDGRTWLHTGDLGRMDADGFFYFSVRAKRMIKSSGFNVHPAAVEAVLLEHPWVAEACVFGVPDPAQVERVAAAVVLRAPGVPGPQAEADLIAFCRERMIKWSCPREIAFRETLPRTRIGKIDYRAVAEAHVAKGGSD